MTAHKGLAALNSDVPDSRATRLISDPNAKPRFPNGDKTPDRMQKVSPIAKDLGSLLDTDRVSPFKATSFSLPAQEQRETPIRMRATPRNTNRLSEQVRVSGERTHRGTSVPIAAVRPRIMAKPRARPRRSTPSPKVKAPSPHPSPNSKL